MQITAVDTFVLRAQLKEPFAYSQEWVFSRACLLVLIHTDSGIQGWGEAYGPPEPIASVVQTLLVPILVGANPLDIEVLWQHMYSRLRDYGQKGIPVAAISAVDIALWDIAGKALHQPVWQLLGGRFRESLPAYATGLYTTQQVDQRSSLVKEAVGYAERGFRAMKLKAGLDLDEDLRNLRAIHKALGNEIGIMVDVNHSLDAATAIRFGRQLESENVVWLEEPVHPEDYDGYAIVAQALDLPIAGGEAEYTRYGFRELIRHRCVDILQPDLCGTGGITEGRRIVALAHTWGIRCLAHVWGTPVALAAAMQFLLALPDLVPSRQPVPPTLEFDQSPNPLRDLGPLPFTFRNGLVHPLDEVGLGVGIDPDALKHYLVSEPSTISNFP